jgi:predicted trehalose synthase
MPEEKTATTATDAAESFTQADVDRIVADRLKRERAAILAKYADYDELKAKAEGAKSVEERLAQMEQRTADAEARALRSDVAARHGISAEDRDLFLTGTDEATLDAQAKRLAERVSERKKASNVVPAEGKNPQASTGDGLRELTRHLFARADA